MNFEFPEWKRIQDSAVFDPAATGISYAEWLVAKLLNGTLPKSSVNKGFDVEVLKNKKKIKYEVKCRLIDKLNKNPATAVYSAQNRVALVIGNGSYRNAPLRNPVNDARLMRNLFNMIAKARPE